MRGVLAGQPSRDRDRGSRDRAAKLAQLRSQGADPTNTAQARAQRSQALSARKREQLAWEATRPTTEVTASELTERVLPALREVPLGQVPGRGV